MGVLGDYRGIAKIYRGAQKRTHTLFIHAVYRAIDGKIDGVFCIS
jgi:hypothetical protein